VSGRTLVSQAFKFFQLYIYWGSHQSRASRCGICGRQSDTGACFSPCNSVFCCRHFSTNAVYSYIHLTKVI